MTLEHHYEIVVPVDPPEDAWDEQYGDGGTGWPGQADKPWLRAEIGLPYLNAEHSATWHHGTVFNQETGDWENADDYDDAAALVLQDVLTLPDVIHRIYQQNTDESGDWDIGILDEIATLLNDRFNIDVTKEMP